MKRLPLSVFTLLYIVGFVSAETVEPLDSLYRVALSDNIISAQEANTLLQGLMEEEYADSTDIAPGMTNKQQQLMVHGLMGVYLFETGSFNQGLEACKKAVALAREQNDNGRLADFLSTQGACAMRTGRLDEAVASFEECIVLADQANDEAALSSAYSNLASTYIVAATPENGYMDFAVKCIRKSIEIEERMSESPTLSIRYGAATEIYTKVGKYDEAIQMGQKAYVLDSIAGNKLRMARRLSQTGDALFAKRDMQSAEQHYLRSMLLLEEVGDPLSTSINCKQLGELYFENGDRPKALQYWMRGLALAESTGNNNLRLALLEKLYRFYRGHDDAGAIHWLERYTALKDSIFTKQNNELLREYQVRYETAEKEVIINKQRTALRQRSFALVLACALLVILVVTMLLVHGLRNHRKKRLEAEQEVRELKSIISIQEKRTIDRLTHYVALHINEKTLTNEDICSYLGVSQSTLNRQLSAIKGVSIQGFVLQMRMEKAQHLLRTSKESISDVAAMCGYDDATYFARVFKQNCGMPPTKYRASAQSGK